MNNLKHLLLLISILSIVTECKINNSRYFDKNIHNYIDSIYKYTKRETHGYYYEKVSLDRFYLGQSRKEWIFGDSLAILCSLEDLKWLASKEKSPAMRVIVFQLLLKRSPHDAVTVLINDINNHDSVCAVRLDEGLMESITNIRVDMAQGNRSLYNITVADSIALDKAIINSNEPNKINYYKRGKKNRIKAGRDQSETELK